MSQVAFSELSADIVPRSLSLQALRQLWQDLVQQTGSLPAPSCFNPRNLAPVLSDLFLGERVGEGLVRLVITGDNFATLFGHDLDGFPLSLLFTPGSRAELTHTVCQMFERAVPAELLLQFDQGRGKPMVGGRILLLPLRQQCDGTDLLVGCLSLFGALDYRRQQRCSIIGHAPACPIRSPQTKAAPPVSLTEPTPAANSDSSHLRLVFSKH